MTDGSSARGVAALESQVRENPTATPWPCPQQYEIRTVRRMAERHRTVRSCGSNGPILRQERSEDRTLTLMNSNLTLQKGDGPSKEQKENLLNCLGKATSSAAMPSFKLCPRRLASVFLNNTLAGD